MSDTWGTDTPVSAPEPIDPKAPVLVNFGAFGFTAYGMVHNVTSADMEALTTPMFAPEGFQGGTRLSEAHDPEDDSFDPYRDGE